MMMVPGGCSAAPVGDEDQSATRYLPRPIPDERALSGTKVSCASSASARRAGHKSSDSTDHGMGTRGRVRARASTFAASSHSLRLIVTVYRNALIRPRTTRRPGIVPPPSG